MTGAPHGVWARTMESLGHRARSTSWREHASAWREAMRHVSRPLPAPASRADLTVVLPQYARLQNVELAVWLALASPRVARVIVVNDNPRERLDDHLTLRDPRVVRVEHAHSVGPVCRYLEARSHGGERFVSVDDDLFLLPRQYEALADALVAEPDRPHGLYGQRWHARTQGFVDNLVRTDGAVDVLVCGVGTGGT
ncbi:MAG: hypothetical protein WCJ30_24855, partial [Deltaproteobacteria bacterium]